MTTDLFQRIRAVRSGLGLTQEAFGALFGVSKAAVSQWEAADATKRTTPDVAKIQAIASAGKRSMEWLLTGVGTGSDAPADSGEDYEPHAPSERDFALIQQLDLSASCGDGCFVEHVVVKGGLAFKRTSLHDFGVTEANARIIYASGGSMAPTIQDGCVVMINITDTTPREGKIFAICMPDGSLVLKRLVQEYRNDVGDYAWVMKSDNPDKKAYSDKLLPPDDRTHIVGRAIWNDNRL